MKNIVQLVGKLKNGGVLAVVSDYAHNIDKNRFKFSLACLYLERDSIYNQILSDENIEVTSLLNSEYSPSSFWAKLRDFVIYTYRLGKYLEFQNIDVLHVHSIKSYALFLNRKHIRNTKVFYTVHNPPETYFLGSIPKKINRYFLKKLIDSCDLQLVALHKDMANELNDMFKIENSIVINNPIKLDRFDEKLYIDKKIEYLNQLNINESDLVIGTIGRLEQQKNHFFLLEILAHLVKVKTNIKLILIGSGSQKNQLVQKVKEVGLEKHIVFLENRSDIPELLSVMDVFILPSRYEGLGIVLIEAQAMGVKCVVSEKIPSAAFVSEKITKVNLNDNISAWVDAILKDSTCSQYNDISNYDIKHIILELEELYNA